MCLIVYHNPTQHTAGPDREILARGLKQNPHGAGLLRWEGNRWSRERRMDLTDRQLDRWIAQSQGKPFAVHFRWSTGGAKEKSNCHPFDLGAGYFLMHNGTLTIKPTAADSDTAILSAAIKKAGIAPLLSGKARDVLEAVRNNSRLLIAQPDGSIFRLGDWHDDETGSYSNQNCHRKIVTEFFPRIETYKPKYSPRYRTGTEPADPPFVGLWCSERLCYVDPEGICRRWDVQKRDYIVIPDPQPTTPRPQTGLIKPVYVPACTVKTTEDAVEESDDFWSRVYDDERYDRNFRRWDWS